MRIGVDFDNTIVCYDGVFHQVALERGLVTEEVPANKNAVRNHLRSIGREDDWTEMQGYVYGARMGDAAPYEGVREFFRDTIAAGIDLFIVSHKTKHPYAGPKYDLHASARGWLEEQGFFDPEQIGLPRERAFFELTLQDKLGRIGSLGCDYFVDDLPELLSEPTFPERVNGLLFDPKSVHGPEVTHPRLNTWLDAPQRLRAA